MTSQRDDLIKAEADLQRIVEELEQKMEVQFRTQFALMNENFQRTFVKLFGGGKAELRLTDPKDALSRRARSCRCSRCSRAASAR